MADKMIERSEFFEYMHAFEERFNGRMQASEQRIGGRMDEFEQRIGGRMDAFEQGINGRMQASEQRTDGRMDAFEQRITSRIDVHFDETQRLVRLSFEAIDALRETTDRGFADLGRDNHENKTLLEAALTQVRTRVDRLERD